MMTVSNADLKRNVMVAVLSLIGFAVLFGISWKISEKYIKMFRGLNDSLKADFAARINSTVHALVVCCLVYASVIVEDFDGEGKSISGSYTLANITFSFSIGYFLWDFFVIVWWMVPMWTVFVIHHLIALLPYCINNFVSTCTYAQYELLLFLLVEMSTLPLNAMTFTEELGGRDTRLHRVCFYVMYAVWAVFRVALPIYVVYCIWYYAFPHVAEEPLCLVPSTICGHLIAAFCIGIFFVVLTPDLYKRLRGTGNGKQLPGLDGLGEDLERNSTSLEIDVPYRGMPDIEEGSEHQLRSPSFKTMGSIIMEGPDSVVEAVRAGLLPPDSEMHPPRPGMPDRTTSGALR